VTIAISGVMGRLRVMGSNSHRDTWYGLLPETHSNSVTGGPCGSSGCEGASLMAEAMKRAGGPPSRFALRRRITFIAVASSALGDRTVANCAPLLRRRCLKRRGQLNPQRQIGVPVHDQSGQYLVLRVTRELRYDVFSKYTAWTPGGAHNIHTAGVGSTNPRFDSSGCQVIRGGFPRDGVFPTGPFRAFRDAIGLRVDTAEETPGSGTIEYMLLTGREAELAARAESNFVGSYQCLRFGSSGPEVTALQTRLFERFPTVAGRSVTTDTPGTFGIGSSLAALAEKKETAGEEDYTSPIVTIDR
jgi:hypothetical protein